MQLLRYRQGTLQDGDLGVERSFADLDKYRYLRVYSESIQRLVVCLVQQKLVQPSYKKGSALLWFRNILWATISVRNSFKINR